MHLPFDRPPFLVKRNLILLSMVHLICNIFYKPVTNFTKVHKFIHEIRILCLRVISLVVKLRINESYWFGNVLWERKGTLFLTKIDSLLKEWTGMVLGRVKVILN